MVEIDIPHVFLDVEELAKRWHCGIGVIEMLAETGQIGCCIRPVALEIALDSNWPEKERPSSQIPLHHHLDQKEIYRLFRHPTIPQIINSHKKKIPNAPDCSQEAEDSLHLFCKQLTIYKNKQFFIKYQK